MTNQTADLNKPAPAIPAPSGRFSDDELHLIRAEFVPRFREAFDHANNAEIARRLKTSDTTIKSYTDGNRLPIPEMLLQITRVTGCNLHWLLTGKGPKRVEKAEPMFSEAEEAIIRQLARTAGRSFDEEVAILAAAAARLTAEIL